MKRTILVAVVFAAACGKSSHKAEAPVDAMPFIHAAHALADRVCGCNNDPACVKLARADWDAGKKAWFEARKSFLPGNAVTFDSEVGRMAACGDAAGLTFWHDL